MWLQRGLAKKMSKRAEARVSKANQALLNDTARLIFDRHPRLSRGLNKSEKYFFNVLFLSFPSKVLFVLFLQNPRRDHGHPFASG